MQKSATLLLNRDQVKLWQVCGLLWFGSYLHSPHSLQMAYTTFMPFDKGERHLISKILYQVCSFLSRTTFLRQGGLTPGVTINMLPSEKHSLTSSHCKTKGMVGRLFMNEESN